MKNPTNKHPAIVEKLISYQEGSVVSREILKNKGGTITLFAFDRGQGLSEHKTPFDAFVYILDGEVEITVAGIKHTVSRGGFLHMPANQPHSLYATAPFKMMLVMIKT